MTVEERKEAAKAARRQYQKEWRAKNKDKIKATMDRYWEKKAGLSPEKDGEPCKE